MTDQTKGPAGRWTAAGWLAVALFAAIYAIELLPHHGPPVTIRWLSERMGRTGLIVLNIGIVLAFLALLPYRRPTKSVWKGRGAFAAFVIALMTEMFGWPLVIFLLSPLVDIPPLARSWFGAVGHWPARVGTGLSLLGIALIVLGWIQIHRAEGVVTTGIYAHIRHPQYTGMLLFTFGWILHWPSYVTLALWPILAAAYIWLAGREERDAIAEFGEAYRVYADRTKRFVPLLI